MKNLIVTPGNDLDSMIAAALVADKVENCVFCFPLAENRQAMQTEIDEKYADVDNIYFIDCCPTSAWAIHKKQILWRKGSGGVYVYDHHPFALSIDKSIEGYRRFDYNSIELVMYAKLFKEEKTRLVRLLTLVAEQNDVLMIRNFGASMKGNLISDDKKPYRETMKTIIDMLNNKEHPMWEKIVDEMPKYKAIKAAKRQMMAQQKVIDVCYGGIQFGLVASTKDDVSLFLKESHRKCIVGYAFEDAHTVSCVVRSTNQTARCLATMFPNGDGMEDAAGFRVTPEKFISIMRSVDKVSKEAKLLINMFAKIKGIDPVSITPRYAAPAAECYRNARRMSRAEVGSKKSIYQYVYFSVYALTSSHRQAELALEKIFFQKDVVESIENRRNGAVTAECVSRYLDFVLPLWRSL